MGGTLNISDFSKTIVAYPSLDGKVYALTMRSVYLGAGGGTNLIALGTGANAGPLKPAHRAAHTYLHTTDAAGNLHKRRVPINPQTPSGTPAPPVPGTIDGLTGWVVGGYIGEKIRGTI